MTAPAYETIELTRDGGVAELRAHSGGGPVRWNATLQRELPRAITDVAGDGVSKVLIITGTGDSWCQATDRASFAPDGEGIRTWEPVFSNGKRLLRTLLDFDLPVIGAVNGPAFIHAEVPLLADVVLATDTAVFADKTHFLTGTVPGDGVNLVWPWLIGHGRAKYFLMTGQEIDAEEAKQLGFVNEVLPADRLLPRAWELALEWAERPLPFLRYCREALNIFERQHLLNCLPYGLALEGVAYADAPPGHREDL